MAKLSLQELALLRRLPFYIEHKLLQQMQGLEPVWQMMPTDFTWQALCRYYALALKQHPRGEDVAAAKALRQWLATGNRLNGFQYPTCWNAERIESFRDPSSAADELEDFIDGFAKTSPASASCKVIPLTGFRRHMKKKPSGLLKLSKITGVEKWPVSIFDDGLFQSGNYDDQDDYRIEGEDIFADSRKPTLLNHATLDAHGVRLEIWRRWKSDWCWAQPPDILTEDDKRFDGIQYMAALVAQFLWKRDEAVEMLNAVPAWPQGQDRIVAAVAEAIHRWEASDPTGTHNKLEKLSESAKALLFPHGIWNM